MIKITNGCALRMHVLAFSRMRVLALLRTLYECFVLLRMLFTYACTLTNAFCTSTQMLLRMLSTTLPLVLVLLSCATMRRLVQGIAQKPLGSLALKILICCSRDRTSDFYKMQLASRLSTAICSLILVLVSVAAVAIALVVVALVSPQSNHSRQFENQFPITRLNQLKFHQSRAKSSSKHKIKQSQSKTITGRASKTPKTQCFPPFPSVSSPSLPVPRVSFRSGYV